MKLRDFLKLYDDRNSILVINDDDLNCLCYGDFWNVKISDFEDREVVAFWFYDNELYVRVRESK